MESWGPSSLGLHCKAEMKRGVAVSMYTHQTHVHSCVDPLKDPTALRLQAFSVMVFAESKVPHAIDTLGDGFAAAVSALQMNPGNSNPACCQETQHGVQPVLHPGIAFHSPDTPSCQS